MEPVSPLQANIKLVESNVPINIKTNPFLKYVPSNMILHKDICKW